ncbi:T9SS type A sorting domain-containing protein, partial [Crocinitomix sp.]|nr:T9SS type A sorting domain-containing protein [Crocinitomix sp.]
AYKRRNSGTDEYLRFYISNDCGESWVLRKNIAGDDLGPEIENSSYEPENQSEWYQVYITNINPTYYTANFRYKFEFKNDNGNNIYIDDINFFSESMVSIDELEDNMQTTVYPNPSSSEISILLGSALTDQVTISMLNSLGQQIDIVYAGQIPFGENIIPYSVTDLPKGIYYINIISASGDSSTIRFIKN